MVPDKTKFTSVDEYIGSFPKGIRIILQQIRNTVKEAAPEAVETIKYQMPTFTLHGNLIHFGAFRNHIGIYPVPKGDNIFRKELSVYVAEKSTIRLPFDKPMPLDLIKKIIELRVKETESKIIAINLKS
jgi:uncharacterized protein YdhG (YjbR/CyaY superfamily)